MTGIGDVSPALARRIFDERTAALAERGSGSAAAAGEHHAVFAIGRGVYALPMAAVAGVSTPGPVAPLPGAHPAVAGIARIGGRFVLVGDAARLFSSPDGAGRAGHLLVLAGDPPVALAVDRVLGIAALDRGDGGEAPRADDPVAAVARLPVTGVPGVDTVTVLDRSRLVSALLPAAPLAPHPGA